MSDSPAEGHRDLIVATPGDPPVGGAGEVRSCIECGGRCWCTTGEASTADSDTKVICAPCFFGGSGTPHLLGEVV